jgi:translocation protein SEC66
LCEQAEALVEGWGQVIFQSANEFNQHNLLRERLFELKDKKEADITWWATKKAGIQSEFLKELDAEAEKTA